MAAAVRAHDLGANHPVRPVCLLVDGLTVGRRVERGPAAAGVVLRLRAEELGAAAGAPVGAGLERVVALSLSQRRNQRYLEAELWRVDGELAYRSGASEAAASLRRAVEVADAQGASWLELRALHSLARGYPDLALREQLGDLVETIPSGHDLPAFRAATALLNESR